MGPSLDLHQGEVAGDCLLAQKIILENCEEEALRIAERF